PEVFDPSAAVQPEASPTPRIDAPFSRAGDPIQARALASATKLHDGQVLIVGGLAPDRTVQASAEIYDPVSDHFTATGGMRSGRYLPTTLLLGDGRVLVAGGYSQDGSPVSSLEIYDPASGQFSNAGVLPSTSNQVGIVQLPSGATLVIGGDFDTGSVVYTYAVASRTLSQSGTIPGCVVGSGDVVLPDGRLVIFCTDSAQRVDGIDLYDPATGQSAGLHLEANVGSVIRLADGRLLVNDPQQPDSTDLFEPATGSISDRGPVINGAVYAAAERLADGRVLFVGDSAAAIWNPSTDGVTSMSPSLTNRSRETLTLLNDGRVLIAGGTTWPADRFLPHPPGAELFDPATAP
ncbi:MAG: kelch repeat-containing protein, partial [Candidatus Limnocylindrales bacterium]